MFILASLIANYADSFAIGFFLPVYLTCSFNHNNPLLLNQAPCGQLHMS
jgi:fluoride ion exporter CrcB/FEX